MYIYLIYERNYTPMRIDLQHFYINIIYNVNA